MNRREFIALIGGATAWPPVALSQQPPARLRRIGILLFSDADRATINPFLRGLEGLGYIDGKTVTIDYRDAEAIYERLPELADDLVRTNPDVIFSFGGEQAPIVKKATATIPIVVVVSNDPVESGLVAGLGRPGGNNTGVTYIHEMLAGQSVELLKDAVPAVNRVAILWDSRHTDPEFRETLRASRALGVRLQSLEVRGAADFEGALQAAAREQAEALIVTGSRLVTRHRHTIGDFAAKNGLILVGVPKWLMEVGALLTYGPNTAELHRRAATYVDKTLRGATPAELPMRQPATFELTINLTTAKALGLTIPPALLARADEVIE